jgi:hypothetical protein
MQLVAQAEAPKASPGGAWFGLEVLQDEDRRYWVVIHTSMYSGIQRTSHWATQPVMLEATEEAAALDEARDKLRGYVRAVQGIQ